MKHYFQRYCCFSILVLSVVADSVMAGEPDQQTLIGRLQWIGSGVDLECRGAIYNIDKSTFFLLRDCSRFSQDLLKMAFMYGLEVVLLGLPGESDDMHVFAVDGITLFDKHRLPRL